MTKKEYDAEIRMARAKATAIGHLVLNVADPDSPFDPLEPACEICGDAMELNDGCEWSEEPGENICNLCAQKLVKRIRELL